MEKLIEQLKEAHLLNDQKLINLITEQILYVTNNG